MGFKKVYKRIQPWLLPVVAILFILELATFPFVVSITDIARDGIPDDLLTYHDGELLWDSGGNIDENGDAHVSLFKAYYDGVKSGNGDNVIAPGTAGSTTLRLANGSNEEIAFTAVVYQIKASDNLPIITTFEGAGFEDAADYIIPPNVEPETIIRCVQGKLKSGSEQDFTIQWHWSFAGDEETDALHTLLGNAAASGNGEDDVIIGFNLYIHDGNGLVFAGVPMIHPIGLIEVWIVMLSLSAVTLVILLVLKRWEKKKCGQ